MEVFSLITNRKWPLEAESKTALSLVRAHLGQVLASSRQRMHHRIPLVSALVTSNIHPLHHRITCTGVANQKMESRRPRKCSLLTLQEHITSQITSATSWFKHCSQKMQECRGMMQARRRVSNHQQLVHSPKLHRKRPTKLYSKEEETTVNRANMAKAAANTTNTARSSNQVIDQRRASRARIQSRLLATRAKTIWAWICQSHRLSGVS